MIYRAFAEHAFRVGIDGLSLRYAYADLHILSYLQFSIRATGDCIEVLTGEFGKMRCNLRIPFSGDIVERLDSVARGLKFELQLGKTIYRRVSLFVNLIHRTQTGRALGHQDLKTVRPLTF